MKVGPCLSKVTGSRLRDRRRRPGRGASDRLPGATLMPGMIEGHSHLFLHPYNEKFWDDQVLHEPLALRTARAVVQAEQTLDAGFTTERDLGTEGAGFADAGFSRPSTRASSPALACSSRPRPSSPAAPMGRRDSSRASQSRRARRKSPALRRRPRCSRPDRGRRRSLKFYADYHWGNGEPTPPTLSQAELTQASRPLTMPAGRSPSMRRLPKACAAPSRRRGHDRAWLWRHRRGVQADARQKTSRSARRSPRQKPMRAISRSGTARNPHRRAFRRTAALSSSR